MRIAHIVSTFPPYKGGIGNSAYNMAEVLSDLEHEVTVFTPNYGCQDEDNGFSLHEGKFNIVRLKPLFKFGNAAFIPQLFWRLKDFDIVHFHYPFFGAIKPVLLAKLIYGKNFKLITHYHMDNRARGFKGAIFYLYRLIFLPLAARASSVITCASLDYVKHSDLRAYYHCRPEKFKQILFGVNLEQFVIYHDNASQANSNTILFVGGLDKAHYFKGLENLIAAVAEINGKSKHNRILLQVVGNGSLLEYYKKRAHELGAGALVKFHNQVGDSELVGFYNRCDCLVLPSINQGEAFGLALLEAMACAKPVIASNLPGVRSVFKNGVEGLLVKPGDIKDLKEKIKYILEHKKLSLQMGQAGRELVERKYTWAKVGSRLNYLYHFLKYTPQ